MATVLVRSDELAATLDDELLILAQDEDDEDWDEDVEDEDWDDDDEDWDDDDEDWDDEWDEEEWEEDEEEESPLHGYDEEEEY